MHFAAAFVTGAMAEGLDFDQLRSRSALSRVASPVYDVLTAPHSAVIRAMPNRWLTQSAIPIIPLWLIGHSLLWGMAASAMVLARRAARDR